MPKPIWSSGKSTKVCWNSSLIPCPPTTSSRMTANCVDKLDHIIMQLPDCTEFLVLVVLIPGKRRLSGFFLLYCNVWFPAVFKNLWACPAAPCFNKTIVKLTRNLPQNLLAGEDPSQGITHLSCRAQRVGILFGIYPFGSFSLCYVWLTYVKYIFKSRTKLPRQKLFDRRDYWDRRESFELAQEIQTSGVVAQIPPQQQFFWTSQFEVGMPSFWVTRHAISWIAHFLHVAQQLNPGFFLSSL